MGSKEAHYYAEVGTWTPEKLRETAQLSANRTGTPQWVHWHRHGDGCNDRCERFIQEDN